MPASPSFNVSELIDTQPIGVFQMRIVALCAVVALLDSLDLQSIGLAVPAMIADLHIRPSSLGAVFSAALAGLALGAFSFGLLADRVGRKAVLVGATVCFGVFTICTALAPNLGVLLAYRFCAGARPRRRHAELHQSHVRIRAPPPARPWSSLGSGPAFRSAAWPAVCWHPGSSRRSVGNRCSGLAACCRFWSARRWRSVCRNPSAFWSLRRRRQSHVRRLLQKAFPAAAVPADAKFVLNEERSGGVSVRRLFAMGRAIGTTVLWISFFIAFMMLVTNSARRLPTSPSAKAWEIGQSAHRDGGVQSGIAHRHRGRQRAGHGYRRRHRSADRDARQRGFHRHWSDTRRLRRSW